MKTTDEAIREFAEMWGIKQNDEPTFDPHTENPYYGYTHCAKQCLSDLTALISEHYYPKEFVEWTFKGCPFIIGENGAGKIIAFSVRDGKQYTFDELYQYYKENEQ